MLKGALRACRSHPVLAAVIIGAVFGGTKVIAMEIGGFVHNGSDGVLSLLWSSGSHNVQPGAVQTATLLLIEFAGNMLVFALLLAVPVAIAVALQRIFIGRSRSEADSEAGHGRRTDRL